MAEWLTTPYAWFSFAVCVFIAGMIGYVTRGIVERIKRRAGKP